MPDLPFETSLVILVAAVSLLLAVLTLFFLLFNGLARVVKRMRGRPIFYLSVTQITVRFVSVILWIAVSAAVLFLAAFIQSYERFTHKELVAEVRAVPLDSRAGTLYLELTPIRDGKRQPVRSFEIHGDQWALEGDILKWDDWLNFLGIHTMYKLTRVRGRYLNVQDELAQEPSVYSLVAEQERPEWRWLYKYGHRLRFVDAVYGNTVYTFPSEEQVFEVYVTTSGFSVEVREAR